MDKIKFNSTDARQVNVYKMMLYTCDASLSQASSGEPALPGQDLNVDEPRTMTMRQITFTPVAEEY